MLEQYLQVKPVQTWYNWNSNLRKQNTFIMTIIATNLKKLVHFQNFFPKNPENSQTQIGKICVKQGGVLLRLQFLGALYTCKWKNAVYRKKKSLAGEKTNFRLPSQSLKYKNWRIPPEAKDFQRQ